MGVEVLLDELPRADGGVVVSPRLQLAEHEHHGVPLVEEATMPHEAPQVGGPVDEIVIFDDLERAIKTGVVFSI